MTVEKPENLGGEKGFSFLPGSLIPGWLHEKVKGVWGRFTHAFEKAKNQKNTGFAQKIGTFITSLFEDYKELTQESIKNKDRTSKEVAEFIGKNVDAATVQESLELSVFGKNELSPEEQDVSDTFVGVASQSWLDSPEKNDTAVVVSSETPVSDVTLEQKLSSARFSLNYVLSLKKYCKDKNISADALAKKLDDLESFSGNGKGLDQLTSRLSQIFSVQSLMNENPLKLLKLRRFASQLPIDKLQSGNVENADLVSLFPNTSTKNDGTMDSVVKVVKAVVTGQKPLNTDVARFIIGVDGRDIEKLIQTLS